MTFMNLFRRAKANAPPSESTSFFPSVFLTPELPLVELWFDEDGWLQTTGRWSVEHKPLQVLFWKGMHQVIKENYENRLIGTTTHYTALGDGRKTATRFHRHDANKLAGKDYRSVSTHFIVCRDGHIIQLASINDRTWHAARKGLSFTVPATRGNPARGSRNPNHWFVGVDLANWGWLTINGPEGPKTWTGSKLKGSSLYYGRSETSSNKHHTWEDYPQLQVDAYTELMDSLMSELEMPRECNVRHEDIDPGRKVDPGPALPFHRILDDIYKTQPTFVEDDDSSSYWNERAGGEDIA